jgi:methionyl aminopeptidase
MMNPPVRRELRSTREIGKMRAAGLVVWEAHQLAFQMIQPGITTAELNRVFRETFVRHGAEPLFLNYGAIAGERPPFPAETCISINEELVHGIPGSRKLANGDIVSLDTGCRLAGWCADAAVTHPVGVIDAVKQRLLNVTNDVLNLAIELLKHKRMWSEIGREMGEYVQQAGFHVVQDMVGHGIGKRLHEPPQVPNYFSAELAAQEDFDIRPGVVIAIEPMIGVGTGQLMEAADRWTMSTVDRSPSAHFEHTIAITNDGPVRLTGPPTEHEMENVPDSLRDNRKWVTW